MIIAIDGGAGTGKSSTSKGIAKKLGLDYLDTGAMYRAFTLYKIQNLTGDFSSNFEFSLDPRKQLFKLNGEDITNTIREEMVTSKVVEFAKDQNVRKKLIDLQKTIVRNSNNIILEGRDTTSVVAPEADLKIILKTDLAVRENRRNMDGEFVGDLKTRDKSDLQVNDFENDNDNIITIDNTLLSLDETIDKIISLIK